MKIAVEAWAPEYGSPIEQEALEPSGAPVDLDVELPADRWTPVDPPADLEPSGCCAFVDGVRRIDARVWLTDDDGATRIGLCASFAAGLARCEGAAAHLEDVEVRRGLFGRANMPDLITKAGRYAVLAVAGDDLDELTQGVQQRMRALEREIAERVVASDQPPELLLLDGPLSGQTSTPGAIGYVKTHRVAYLPAANSAVIASLAPGQRGPLFVTQTTWSRYSWYLRLPGAEGHPWAGIVRCETSADLPVARARRLADLTARTLPRFASAPHKDPRAPQNLYPIAGLERELRRRLGDAAWVWRALRTAAAAANA